MLCIDGSLPSLTRRSIHLHSCTTPFDCAGARHEKLHERETDRVRDVANLAWHISLWMLRLTFMPTHVASVHVETTLGEVRS